MSEKLAEVFTSVRAEYGEGIIHLLISYLKSSRILFHHSLTIPVQIMEKLKKDAFVKVAIDDMLEVVAKLNKDDVAIWPKHLPLPQSLSAKIIGFDDRKGFDGVISKPLEEDLISFFDAAKVEYKGVLLKGRLEFSKYLFLDRDGVIINYVSYPDHPSQVKLQSGIVEVIKEYRKRNHRIVMVTNQSGIARGYSTQEDFRQVQNRTLELLAQQGQWIDACYFATYLANSDVIQTLQYPSLRKPRTGMLAEESQFWNIDLENSVMIGDNASDVEWAQNAGLGRVFWLDNPELREKSPANMTNVTQVQSLDQILKLI